MTNITDDLNNSLSAAPMLYPVEAIINACSGTGAGEATAQLLNEMLKPHRIEARIALARTGSEVTELAAHAARRNARLVIAGGGDGTISTVAAHLVGTDKALGVLPCGTFNYFARNHGIPLEPEAAIRNLIEGRAAAADTGEINGQLFLNNASLGLYPRILRQREQEYRRWGRSKVAAYFSVLRTMVRPIRLLNLRLSADGKAGFRRTPLIFACCNKYQMREFNLPGSACADEGRLAFYLTRPVGRLGMLRLAVLTFLQRLDDERDLEALCLEEAWISSRQRLVNVAIDGEIRPLTTPLHVRFRRGALRVIVPASALPELERRTEIQHAHDHSLV
ncbi:MAG TPA: diacylglycerol kinase family protein [Blastocatellia bacterium]|nr:diacylglycerol kinase family protein [Blastocatellia bacterium]